MSIEISMEQVKELRDRTGVSIMQCKKALEESGGDLEKALVVLRKKGAQAAEKKNDRTLGAGAVAAYIHGTGTVGAMVELSCETDFVSRNPDFRALAYDIAMHVAASKPEFVRFDDVSAEAIATAKEVFKKDLEGKPEAMHEKIMEGKINAYFEERVLLKQKYIKNPEVTIEELVQGAIQKFGEKTEVARFVRFSVMDK